MVNLDTPVEELPKVGTAYAKKLKKFGVKTIRDLLFYFPARYDDFSEIISIQSARRMLGENVCVQGRVVQIENSHSFKKYMSYTEAVVEDDSGQIKVIWFNQPYMAKSLHEDDFVSLAGKVGFYNKEIYLSNPIHERINEFGHNDELTHTGRIVPVYSETRGLTSRWLRYIIKPLLYRFLDQIQETLPEEIIKKYKFIPIQEAVWQLHFPESLEHADAAKSRFSFEELFLIQLNVLKEKLKLIQKKAPACPMDADLMKTFTDSLPFTLTDSQKKCACTILKDL